MQAISLGGLCGVIWLLLSGYFTNPLLLTLGVASCLLVVFIIRRMTLLDDDLPSLQVTLRTIAYIPWLLWEIVKANLDVAKRILHPNLPISPTIFHVKTSQRSDLGKVIYANSITLTPGTVSIYVDTDTIEVHALSQAAANELMAGAMDRRVSRVEGLQ